LARVLTLIAGLFAIRSHSAFKYFAWEFPKAIYRDFFTYDPQKAESKAEE